MSLKLFASLATVVALAACESTEETRSGMHDWPNPSAEKDGPMPGSAEHFKHTTQDHVFFDLNKAHVKAEGHEAVKTQAAWAAEYPATNFSVEGHCDERGTREYNLALGEKRAAATKKALIAAGVDGKRIETVSYGKEKPEFTGTGEEVWAKNRNTTTVVR